MTFLQPLMIILTLFMFLEASTAVEADLHQDIISQTNFSSGLMISFFIYESDSSIYFDL